ncbi:MAG: SDR family NAD(P)-dependent oxidoreductase, partial [Chloroflexota bacterium]
MTRPVCLMTGATNGFGFEAAKALASQDMHLVLICRSQDRGEAIQQKIHAATGHTPDILLADLLSQAQVKQAAAAFKAKFDRLDVLVNNAGYAYRTREVTAEGYERTFALNYLTYVTLTLELLDLLLVSAPARIVNTASSSHHWNPIQFDNLQGEQEFPPGKFGMPAMYGWSNTYRIMFTYELADRLRDTGVVANTFCPGFVAVQRSTASRIVNTIMPLLGVLAKARSPQEAAEIIVYLATS